MIAEKLYITKRMRGKMIGFQSLNTSPMGNPFCDRMSENPENICSRCYSRKSIQSFHHDGRWIDNGNILKQHYFEEHMYPKFSASIRYFRYNAHGELINANHFWHLCSIAYDNPDITFLLWSKRKGIVKRAQEYIDNDGDNGCVPTNMKIVYSDPKINSLSTEIPFGFDLKFTVFTKEFAKENNIDINCAGKKCMECLICYTDSGITLINEIVR